MARPFAKMATRALHIDDRSCQQTPRLRIGPEHHPPTRQASQFAYFTEQPYGRDVCKLTGFPAIASVRACDT